MPALGDPFLLKLWFQCFENVWQNEVDKVYISLSPRTDVGRKRVNKFIVEFMSKNPKIEIWENPTTSLIDQFKAPIEKCKEDIFVYVQEDAFIFKKGALNRQFEKIESGEFDIVASHQTQITGAFRFFWLNFFFAKIKDILDTDMNFDLGEYGGVDYDIMGGIHIQLQKQNKKIDFIQQTTNDWCHVNSLSSIDGYLVGNDKEILFSIPDAPTKIEILRRIGWWKTCLEVFRDECGEIGEFIHDYDLAINAIMRKVIMA